jgi:prevent-host-death family protein
MSTAIEITEAQAKLTDIIAGLGPHDEVVITQSNRPVARLIGEPSTILQPRQPGNCQGLISVFADDDEHLQDFEDYMP